MWEVPDPVRHREEIRAQVEACGSHCGKRFSRRLDEIIARMKDQSEIGKDCLPGWVLRWRRWEAWQAQSGGRPK